MALLDGLSLRCRDLEPRGNQAGPGCLKALDHHLDRRLTHFSLSFRQPPRPGVELRIARNLEYNLRPARDACGKGGVSPHVTVELHAQHRIALFIHVDMSLAMRHVVPDHRNLRTPQLDLKLNQEYDNCAARCFVIMTLPRPFSESPDIFDKRHACLVPRFPVCGETTCPLSLSYLQWRFSSPYLIIVASIIYVIMRTSYGTSGHTGSYYVASEATYYTSRITSVLRIMESSDHSLQRAWAVGPRSIPCQYITAPADTLMSCPVIMAASSVQRNATTAATCRGSTKVFSADNSARSARTWSRLFPEYFTIPS
jgi:hypothetical protein